LHIRGSIFYHSKFKFHDGLVGQKYIILLNSPSNNEPYLFVKTTSKQRNKPTTVGCIKKHSCFFIPAKNTFFPLDTWVQLYELYPIPSKKICTNKSIHLAGNLDYRMIDAIVSFHPEMVFLANLGVNLHVCLCGDLQVASAQTLDFLGIGQKSSFPDWKLSSTAKSFPDGY